MDAEDRLAQRRLRRAQRKEVDPEFWNKILSSEGLHPEPLPKQIRGPRGTPERDKPKKREFPLSPPGRSQWDVDGHPDIQWINGSQIHNHPETEIQALMEAAPGDQPRLSTEEMEALRDVLVGAIEALDEPMRTVMLLYTGGTPMSEIGQEIGRSKDTVHRLVGKAKGLLAKQLKDHPEVVDYLEEE